MVKEEARRWDCLTYGARSGLECRGGRLHNSIPLVMGSSNIFAFKRIHSTTSTMASCSVESKMEPSGRNCDSNPFPPLQLSPRTRVELQGLGQRLVTRNMDGFETFLTETHGYVDDDEWKLVASKNDIRVYAQHSRTADSSSPLKNAENAVAEMPVILVTGTMEGDLDDLMYGVACTTDEEMRIKGTYLRNDVTRTTVLATVTPPTRQSPFEALCIKWSEWCAPIAVRSVMKHHDFVYMESTGFEHLCNGERVGYHLVHSVRFPNTPVLDTHIRGNNSVNFFYRQRTKNVIDVYAKGYFYPEAGIMRTVAVKFAARTFLTMSRLVYCCNMKKLARALRQHYAGGDSESTKTLSCDATDEKCCFRCGKKQSIFVQAANRTLQVAKCFKKKRHCELCTRYVCSDCKRQHQLAFLLSDQRLKQRLITICQTCELRVLSTSAVKFARDELVERNQF